MYLKIRDTYPDKALDMIYDLDMVDCPPQSPDQCLLLIFTFNWYAHNVVKCPSYINAAFRSSRRFEAYIFIKNQYMLLNYAPHTDINGSVEKGPRLICKGFHLLRTQPLQNME